MTTPKTAAADMATRRRRGGRPLKDADERRGKPVTFWLTSLEFAQLESRMEASGAASMSDFLRAVALENQPRQARRGASRDLAPVVAQLARLGNNLNQIVREARIHNFRAATGTAANDALRELGAYLRILSAAADDPET
jgi:hypothetical protein